MPEDTVTHPAVVLICAWCSPRVRVEAPGVSHGICPACIAKMDAQLLAGR